MVARNSKSAVCLLFYSDHKGQVLMNWDQTKMMFSRDSAAKLEWHLGESTTVPREVQACMKRWHFNVNSPTSLGTITHLSLLKLHKGMGKSSQTLYIHCLKQLCVPLQPTTRMGLL